MHAQADSGSQEGSGWLRYCRERSFTSTRCQPGPPFLQVVLLPIPALNSPSGQLLYRSNSYSFGRGPSVRLSSTGGKKVGNTACQGFQVKGRSFENLPSLACKKVSFCQCGCCSDMVSFLIIMVYSTSPGSRVHRRTGIVPLQVAVSLNALVMTIPEPTPEDPVDGGVPWKPTANTFAWAFSSSRLMSSSLQKVSFLSGASVSYPNHEEHPRDRILAAISALSMLNSYDDDSHVIPKPTP